MAYTCVDPACAAVSHHPEDEKQRYCGRCHRFAEQIILQAELARADECDRIRSMLLILVDHERELRRNPPVYFA